MGNLAAYSGDGVVDLRDGHVEGLDGPRRLNIAIDFGEAERIRMAGASTVVVWWKEDVDLGQVGESARLIEGGRQSTTDAEATFVVHGMCVAIAKLATTKVDADTGGIGGGKVVEVTVNTM